MNLNSFLLRFIARSSNSLVAFVIALDAKLDIFLAQNDDRVNNLEEQVEDLFADAEDEVTRIREQAELKAAEVRAEIAEAVAAAKVLANLKNVLTK
jgi:hypothetical protein